MGKAFLCKSNGGGGGGLAFRVYGNPAPATPKPNDIWVDTDEKITSYIFGATEPEGYAPGMVWITTGASSAVEFSATKKNPVMVYPLSAKQHVNGAWVDKTAKTYQNSVWVDWTIYTYLFKSGEGVLTDFKKTTDGNASITIGTNSIICTYSGSSSISSNLRVQVDFTGKKYLCIEYICTTLHSKGMTVGLLNYETSATTFPSSYIAKAMMEETTEKKIITIPLTGVSGSKCLAVIGASKYEIYNIWTEE